MTPADRAARIVKQFAAWEEEPITTQELYQRFRKHLEEQFADAAAVLPLVRRMREKQREYFRTRSSAVLNECRDLERRLDEALTPKAGAGLFAE